MQSLLSDKPLSERMYLSQTLQFNSAKKRMSMAETENSSQSPEKSLMDYREIRLKNQKLFSSHELN